MSIIYDSNNRIFVKQDYQKHSGKPACYADSPVESFYVNHFVDSDLYNSDYFAFETPMYYTLGGTINYYGQDYWSIFTNVYRPFIKFIFTANTHSFGTGTTIKHNIYRIPYDVFSQYTSETIRKNIEGNKDVSEQTVEETFTDSSGKSTTTTTKRKTTSSNTIEKFAPKIFPEKIDGYGFETTDKYASIKKLLTNPILTLTATTTGISTSVYNLSADEYQKKKGDFKYQLFLDYGQYFVTTQFVFNRTMDDDLSDFYKLDANDNLVPVEYEKEYTETTPTTNHIITGGTFSGITVYGNYFTYFLIPNKPKWETPYVTGQLTTFSPTFFWSHTDDGDSFLLQVVYESGDSQSFSGTVYSYPIDKESSNLSTNEMLGTPDGDWSITQKTTDVVRKYSVPLLYGKNFWYRIGNVKELINIFGVKQKVVTFSDVASATTTASLRNYVYVESDSPHVDEISQLVYPEYLDDSALIEYTLSGSVSGSVVTGATMQLIYPNGNYETQLTDSVGNYYFTGLEPGIYYLNTFYRGYIEDSISVNISGNTTLGVIKLRLIWGNRWDTFDTMRNVLFSE